MDTTSFWNQTAKKTVYPPLEKDLETDVLIIGGGITGVTCAYCLTQQGINPTLIEAGGLCDGTTGNTTGKLTIQHDVIYSNIEKKYGKEWEKLYADSQTEALDFVKKQVADCDIDCQLTKSTANIYAINEKEKETLQKEYETALSLGIDAQLFFDRDFPKGNIAMLSYNNQAVFHPVRYVEALAKLASDAGAHIFCSTKAVHLENDDIKTVTCENGAIIKAKHVVMATQYPFYDGPNLFYTRLYAKRDYGIAVAAKKDWPDGSFINVGQPTRSIRTHVEDGKRILIIVGEDHPTARGEADMEKHFENLKTFADEIAGIDELLAQWSAQDYDTPDQIPYIGRISDHSNVYVAAGYKKWGLTTGTLAGKMISELIAAGNCRYEELYSRTRNDYSSSLGTAIAEIIAPVAELIRSKLEGEEDIENLKQGEGRVIRFEGQKAGIYRDFDDSVTILDISCTHMSTELNFNSAEKSWDCPAHGGRYSTDGKLLEGPPKDSLKILWRGSYFDLFSKR